MKLCLTGIARCTNSSDRQAVVLIDGIPKIAHLQERLSLEVNRIFQQDVVKLDVSVHHTHSASQ